MYLNLEDYLTPAKFAKTYKTYLGRPASRQYIYKLIAKEKTEPGTTGLDIIEVDGVVFVKAKEVEV